MALLSSGSECPLADLPRPPADFPLTNFFLPFHSSSQPAGVIFKGNPTLLDNPPTSNLRPLFRLAFQFLPPFSSLASPALVFLLINCKDNPGRQFLPLELSLTLAPAGQAPFFHSSSAERIPLTLRVSFSSRPFPFGTTRIF